MITESADKNDIGVVVLGHSDEPGIALLALMLFQEHWNRGYESELSHAVVDNLALMLRAESSCLDGKLIEAVLTTSNPASAFQNNALRIHGFEKLAQVQKFDALVNIT